MLLFSTLVVFLVLHSNKSTWWHPRDLVNEMTAAETGQFRLPPQLDVNSGNVSENFKRWKGQVEVYLAASGASEKDDKVQTAIIFMFSRCTILLFGQMMAIKINLIKF